MVINMRFFGVIAVLIVCLTFACKKDSDETGDEQTNQRDQPSSVISGDPSDTQGSNESGSSEAGGAGARGESGEADLSDLEPGESRHFGSPFSTENEALSLSESLEQCVDSGEICRVRAEVATSCQSKGCWFTVTGDNVAQVVRIEMEDYGFFVPPNAHETTAEFEGTLEKRSISQATARHFARESSGEEAAAAIEGPQKGFVWTITGVTLQRPAEL